MKNFLKIVIVIGLIVLGVFSFVPSAAKLGSGTPPTLISSATNTATSVSSSVSTEILAKNTARQYALIVNDSANVIYLSLGGTATANSGVRLNASGGSFEITPDMLFTGAINGLATTTTSVVTVLEM